jgi:PQQ-dependent catabolism-associated beta-propeller protein
LRTSSASRLAPDVRSGSAAPPARRAFDGSAMGRGSRRLALAALALIVLPVLAQPLGAKMSGKVFVTNEKSSTLTILDQTGKVLQTLDTCARPRGMTFNPEHTAIYVGCGDDNTIALYDIASLRLVRRYRNIAAPETFDLHPDGRHLYISNEDDSEMSVLDVESGEIVARYPTGPEPEGVQISKDGRLAFVASEVANVVHVFDIAQQKPIKDIPVGSRPRRFALTPDNKELWVSTELSGQVEIIDVETLAAKGKVEFQLRAIRREQFTPVDVIMTRDGARAYVALGRANHVAVINTRSREVTDYIVVGKRAWGLRLNGDETRLWVANGLSDDVSIVDTRTNKVLLSVPVGQVPYGILIDDR